ncbi:Multisite-specific tRNA:(cytosine-C(5))-methyltransferase trm4b [Ceratocystis fimbriata CBS 114723]|uniref:Multisite-specific tRNA:(Cytosine-C(5))-methyltransferase trm4b n=1 Tax=Ceratocystis fimbriata CBS 114723 TaxID=1035309 RepID=A0A2C5X9P2_9PEZI|nr:Multisite-specific tRNA:(cytosine-C(5))-methyltransferase trm4b [Ceratocystis fimbriata CBS 114723]
MGRGGRRRGGRKGGGRGGRNNGNEREASSANNADRRVSYPQIVKENEKLEKYYNDMLQMPEDERKEFWEALRRELPNSFRFCGSKGHALAVRNLLQTRYIPEITRIKHEDGNFVQPPKPVSWYPDGLAYDMTTPKNVVRRFPPFAAFQKFLVSETSVGNISRQEIVSMIPPLLIDLKPGMSVLDLCAAPGSKSAQLLEMVHAGEEARIKKVLRQHATEDGLALGTETEEEANADLSADPSDQGRATGLIVANDMDYKRCHMLVHQLKRFSSANLLVTNHDASAFPSIRLPDSYSDRPGKRSYLKFDRILADVPCTGDGTLRKNMTMWRSWTPNNALGLHIVQVRILVRALQMLKVGGRVVYSTCSMNPIENEAVVAAAIDRCGGPEKVGILDCSNQLVGMKRKPGMKTWQVMDKSGNWWNSWQEIQDKAAADSTWEAPGKITEPMFPPPAGSLCADLPLERCIRVYAYQQDTGSFFITVLEKKAEIRARNENIPKDATVATSSMTAAEGDDEAEVEAATATETEAETANGKRKLDEVEAVNEMDVDAKKVKTDDEGSRDASETPKAEAETKAETKTEAKTETTTVAPAEPKERRKDTSIRYEDPFKFLAPDHPVLDEIFKFYHLSPRFPRDRFMVRNATGQPLKAIYYCSTLARDILGENDLKGVKFLHGGVKMFVRQDVPNPDVCRWRIQSEGMPMLHGYLGEDRVVHLRDRETLRRLLIEMFPRISDGEWQKLGDIGERVRDMSMGCYMLRVELDADPNASPEALADEAALREPMVLPLWKSISSLNLMLPKEDRAAMLLRLFNDNSPLVNNSLLRQKNIQKQQEEEAKSKKTEAEAGAEAIPAIEEDINVEDAPTPEGMD